MALLVGRHVNKIDKKGRVSVPKSFRASFDGQGFSGIYAYPSFKFPAIEACGEAFMQRISASLEKMEMFSEEQDDLAAAILESAHALPFDPEGRIVLPPPLLAHAGIDGEALFVGRGAQMQIWNGDNYEKHRQQALQRARSRGATLQLSPALPTEGPS